MVAGFEQALLKSQPKAIRKPGFFSGDRRFEDQEEQFAVSPVSSPA
jgi:hypothetical protein